MALSPAQLVAAALALAGAGLGASAFVGQGVDALRLGVGITLVVAALLTSGLQLLNRNGASATRDQEEA